MKIVLIIVWFGSLPNYFSYWIQSAKYNQDYDFLFFTDSNDIRIKGNNIKKVHITFNEIKELVYKKLNVQMNSEKAFKMCDLRPAYGYLFYEYIKKYDYWGHIDIDTILGNLNHFLLNDNIFKYDKIFDRGHFSLYRNNPEVNKRFMLPFNNIDYKLIFSSKYSFAFDESCRQSITTIYNKYNFEYLKKIKNFSFDVNCGFYDFFDVNTNIKADAFIWNNGKLMYRSNDKLIEIGYVHLQKRKISLEQKYNNNNIDLNTFYIYPNSITIKQKTIQYPSIYIKFKYYVSHHLINNAKIFFKVLERKIVTKC